MVLGLRQFSQLPQLPQKRCSIQTIRFSFQFRWRHTQLEKHWIWSCKSFLPFLTFWRLLLSLFLGGCFHFLGQMGSTPFFTSNSCLFIWILSRCEKGLWDFIWSYTTIHITFFFLSLNKAMGFFERVIDKKAIIGVFTELRWWGAKN